MKKLSMTPAAIKSRASRAAKKEQALKDAKLASATNAVKQVAHTKSMTKQEQREAAKQAIKDIPMVHAYVPEAKTPYSAFFAKSGPKRCYTVAAFVYAGMATMSQAGLVEYRKGQLGLWSSIVGDTAAPYWRSKGWVDKEGLTKAGRSEIGSSFARGKELSGKGEQGKGFFATPELVRQIVKFMKSGGKGEVDYRGGKVAVQFNGKVGAAKQ